MKTGNLKLVKRNVASALLATSAVISITPVTEAMSMPLIVTADIQESVTPTWMNPASRCDSPLEGRITGTGTSSLGDVSVVGSDCITPNSPNFPTSFEFGHGKMIFTLPSGDQFFANYHGFLTQTDSTSDSPSMFEFTDARFKIKGGTGDFEDAEGRGKISGTEDIFSGIGSMSATGRISDFDNDRDEDDEDDDKDRKKKDKGDKESDRDDRKKNGDGKEKDDGRAEKSKADRHIAGGANSFALTGDSSNTTMITRLDSGLFPNNQSAGQTIGAFFYQDRSGQSLAINALPEVGSLSLLGIGLAGLLVVRRRKPANSTSAIDPATGR